MFSTTPRTGTFTSWNIRTPLRASIRMIATSAVEAPVAMLRVYCSWPGVSAMMNLRVLVAK